MNLWILGSVNNPNNAVRDRQGRITSMIASMAIFFAVIWAPVHLFTLSVRLVAKNFVLADNIHKKFKFTTSLQL